MMSINKKINKHIRKRNVLSQNERVMGAVHGGLLTCICTDKRVVFYMHRSFGRWAVESFPLEHVSYVQFKKGILSSELVIKSSSGEKTIVVKKKTGIKMQDIISNQILIKEALATGVSIPEPDPMMELQLMYVHGEIKEHDYLRRMTVL